jgi:hypothetical protein
MGSRVSRSTSRTSRPVSAPFFVQPMNPSPPCQTLQADLKWGFADCPFASLAVEFCKCLHLTSCILQRHIDVPRSVISAKVKLALR